MQCNASIVKDAEAPTRMENVRHGVTYVQLVDEKNHWAKVCTNKNENTARYVPTRTTWKEKKITGCTEVQKNQYKHQNHSNRMHSVNASQRDNEEMFNKFEQMSVDSIKNQIEIFTNLVIKLPNLPGTHFLKAYVDTRYFHT